MEKCHNYIPPLDSKKKSARQDEKWDEAVNYFNTKQFDKVLPTLLDYIDPTLQSLKSDDSYKIPHGSVIVEIRQTENNLEIVCPFVNISEAQKTPVMRRLSEIRMQPLNLTNVYLANECVEFRFTCPVNLCEPYKVYGVLHEICYYADMYDDEFIEKFGARHIQEPRVGTYSKALKEEAYHNYQKILDEGIRRYDHYMATRYGNGAWYTLNITLKRLEYYAEPQGFLRTEIERAIDSIYDGKRSFHDRLLNGREKLVKLKGYSLEKFSESLYRIETFVPYKYGGKKESIREKWEQSYYNIQESMNHSNMEEACLLMLSEFYSLYYYYLLNEDVDQPLNEAMAKANGLSWNEAAPILFEGMRQVMEEDMFQNNFGMDLSKIMGQQMEQSMAIMQKMMKGFSDETGKS